MVKITIAGRCCGTAASAVPGAALLLLPKCPVCLAALAGVSVASATYAHEALVIFSAAALSYGVTKLLRHAAKVKKENI